MQPQVRLIFPIFNRPWPVLVNLNSQVFFVPWPTFPKSQTVFSNVIFGSILLAMVAVSMDGEEEFFNRITLGGVSGIVLSFVSMATPSSETIPSGFSIFTDTITMVKSVLLIVASQLRLKLWAFSP